MYQLQGTKVKTLPQPTPTEQLVFSDLRVPNMLSLTYSLLLKTGEILWRELYNIDNVSMNFNWNSA